MYAEPSMQAEAPAPRLQGNGWGLSIPHSGQLRAPPHSAPPAHRPTASHCSFPNIPQANLKFRTLAASQPEQSCTFLQYGSSLTSFLPNSTGLTRQEALPDDLTQHEFSLNYMAQGVSALFPCCVGSGSSLHGGLPRAGSSPPFQVPASRGALPQCLAQTASLTLFLLPLFVLASGHFQDLHLLTRMNLLLSWQLMLLLCATSFMETLEKVVPMENPRTTGMSCLGRGLGGSK